MSKFGDVDNLVIRFIKENSIQEYVDERFKEENGYANVGYIDHVGITRNNSVVHLSVKEEYYCPIFLETRDNVVYASRSPKVLDFKIYTGDMDIGQLVKIYNQIAAQDPQFIVEEVIPIEGLLKERIDSLVASCNAQSIRESLGKILLLPKLDIFMLMNEYVEKPDIRFGDNLLAACHLFEKMKEKWGNELFNS